MLKEMVGENRLIECCAAAMGRMIEADSPPPRALLTVRRFALSRLCMQHMGQERKLLYPMVRAAAVPDQVAQADAAYGAMIDLFTDLVAYNDHWSSEAIEADWLLYCRETRVLLDRIAERIRVEEETVYPLVLDAGSLAEAGRPLDPDAPCPNAQAVCSHRTVRAA